MNTPASQQPAAITHEISAPTVEQLVAADAAVKHYASRFTPAGLGILRDLWLTEPELAISIAVGTLEIPQASAARHEGEKLAATLRMHRGAREAFVELYVRDPKSAQKLAGEMPPLPAGENPAKDSHTIPPPRPMHRLRSDSDFELTDAEKAHEQAMLIKQIREEGRYTDYSRAHDEARRRSPSLFL